MAMAGFVSGSRFGAKVGLRVAIFAGLTFGFPFIVYGLILATNARSVGGAAGALAVVAGIYLKPIIIAAFLISIIGPCWRRMSSLGLPAIWGLLVPLLFVADAGFLKVAGTHWGVSFSLGIWSVSFPYFALTAIALMMAMAVAMPSSGDTPPGLARFGIMKTIAIALALAIIVMVLMRQTLSWWFYALAWSRTPVKEFPVALWWLDHVIRWILPLQPFVCALFVGVVAWIAISSRRNAEDDGEGLGPTPPVGPVPAAPSRAAF
jgi:hypothetical protein